MAFGSGVDDGVSSRNGNFHALEMAGAKNW